LSFSEIFHEQEQIRLHQGLQTGLLVPFHDVLLDLNQQGWQKIFEHGDFTRWCSGFEALPDTQNVEAILGDTIQIKAKANEEVDGLKVEQALKALCPWRKGPFELFDVLVDAEWRSDWKWQRVLPHISSLRHRHVLDIGCGSGYHMWRMLEAGATQVYGIDPTPLFTFHFATMKRYQIEQSVFLLPVGIDDLPDDMQCFDTVFSMGILYHRKSPIEHLYQLKSLLREGGELVLETLVIDGDEQACLVPHGRYAKMRNVWFIPSVLMLENWLRRVGFKNVRCVDLNTTSIEEQRVTEWMRYESLENYLNPDDHNQTIEGHPAPKRAVMVASR